MNTNEGMQGVICQQWANKGKDRNDHFVAWVGERGEIWEDESVHFLEWTL